MRLTVAMGTRPEVVKLSPVVAALRTAGHQVRCLATGQQADSRLTGDVHTALACPPDETWTLPAAEPARVGALLAHGYAEFAARRPDAVVVLGDTSTAPLLALAARRYGIGVVHLEAGLRSANDRSMEESNRRVLAALATVHLAPTPLAARFLRAEGVPAERIRVVGNPVVDALAAQRVRRVRPDRRRGVLLTAHRATNVDEASRLAELVRLVAGLGTLAAGRLDGPVTFPVHPRTAAQLAVYGGLDTLRRATGVRLVEPLPYRDLLVRLAGSTVVVTDSGGLQEEASVLGVPAVVLRDTTPRWEGVASGAAVLTGLDADRALAAVARLTRPAEQRRIAALPCPYGDGRAAARIVAALAEPALQGLLTPQDPPPAEPGRLPAAVAAALAAS